MIVTTLSVTTYIADKIVSQFIKEEGYGCLKSFFFPKATYRSSLESIIKDTINEFTQIFPIEETLTRFPFYKSQILFDLLNQQILYKGDKSILLVEEFKKNENIIVPNKDQLNIFYKIFIEKVNNSKKLNKLYFDESYKEEIFKISDSLKEIITVSKLILDRVNSIEKKLDSSNTQIEALRNIYSDNISIHGLYRSRGLNSYIKSEKSSSRKNIIDELLLDFKEKAYIHIYGNISMGKTQLAVLICENFENRFWIELKDINPNVIIHVIFKELTNYFNCEINNQNDLKLLISSFPNNSILVFDDLPKFDISQRDLEIFISLIELLKKKDIKILSTSNFTLPNKVVEYLEPIDFIERPVPFLSENEIQEILTAYGATDEITNLIKNTIYKTSSGHPAIVNAICRYLLDLNWNIDANNLAKIFTGDFASNLDEDTFERIFKTISDSQSKDFLYRLKLIIGHITEKEINCISSVNPIIKYPFEKISILSGLWLQKSKPDLYEISPLIKRLNYKNISPVLFKKINNSLGELILSEKRIDQISANKAILYFINAESYNRAGFILSLVLQESLKTPDLYFNWGFGLYWTTTCFPEQMDLYLQSVLRYLQINFNLKIKKDIAFLVSDLENIIQKASTKNINLAHASIFLSLIFSENNHEKSNKYLVVALKEIENLKSIDTKNILSDFSVSIESLIWSNLISIINENGFDTWLISFTQLNTEQRFRSLQGDLSKVSCLLFCTKIYNNFIDSNNTNWEDLVLFFKSIIIKTEPYEVNFLIACCLKYQIRILCAKIVNSKRAEELFEQYILIFKNDLLATFVMHDELGRQLFYLGQNEKALKHLIEASVIDVPKIFTEKIDTFLALNEIFGPTDNKKAHEYILKAVDFQNGNEFIDEVLSSKVIGELAISTWELVNSSDVFYIIEKGIENLLFSYKPFKDYQGTIIRYGHILNYYFHLIANLPLKDIDGSPYEIPFRSCFSKNNELLLEGGYYFEQRKFMLAYLMTQAFEEINDRDLASKWAYICFKLNKEESINPFISLMIGFNIYLILDGKFEEAVIFEIDILKSINELNSGEGVKSKIENKRLAKIIKDGPLTTFEIFDDLLFEYVINFIVIKSLWDYLLTKDDSVIIRLEMNLETINQYFIDKDPLDILKKACPLILIDEQNSASILGLIKADHKLYTQINLLLYLFASFRSTPKEALILHLALIQRLEMISTKIASNSAYKFIVIPFLLDFWNKIISDNESSFFQYNFLVSKGIPKIILTKILSRPKALFEILCYHLEVEPSESQRSWFENK
jgi:hypothetical protein